VVLHAFSFIAPRSNTAFNAYIRKLRLLGPLPQRYAVLWLGSAFPADISDERQGLSLLYRLDNHVGQIHSLPAVEVPELYAKRPIAGLNDDPRVNPMIDDPAERVPAVKTFYAQFLSPFA
jgi:hypothetical protein